MPMNGLCNTPHGPRDDPLAALPHLVEDLRRQPLSWVVKEKGKVDVR